MSSYGLHSVTAHFGVKFLNKKIHHIVMCFILEMLNMLCIGKFIKSLAVTTNLLFIKYYFVVYFWFIDI